MIPGKKYTPEDLLRLGWKRKWLVVIPGILLSLGSFLWIRSQPKLYRSETLIVVIPPRVPQNYVRSTVGRLPARLQFIQQDVLSRTRLETLIHDLDLYPERAHAGFIEDAVDQMRTSVTVQIVRGDTFSVAFVYTNPRKTMQVSERLASMFIDESLKDREGLMDGTNQFLETELRDARDRLIEHEKKLEAYNRAHAGELPTQLNANLQAMNGRQMQLQSVVDSLSRDRDRRVALAKVLDDLEQQANAPAASSLVALSPSAPDQPLQKTRVTPTTTQLDQARKALADLELRLKPVHPDVLRAKRLVSELEAKAEAEAASAELGSTPAAPPTPGAPVPAPSAAQNGPNSMAARLRAARDQLDQLDRQIAANETEQSRLKDDIANLQGRVDATPTRESELVDLTRDYGTLQNTYRTLLAKSQEAMLSSNVEERQIGEQFKVLDPARLPQSPFSPNVNRTVIMGTFGGLALGACLIALVEYRDNTLKTDDDVVTVLSLPVLALVPVMQTSVEKQRQRRRVMLLSVTSAVTVLGIGGGRDVRSREDQAVTPPTLPMYGTVLRPPGTAVRADAESPVLLSRGPAPRGAVQPAIRHHRAPRHHAAHRRSRHRQDHPRSRSARTGSAQRRQVRVLEQPDADARRVRRVPRL